MKFAVVDIETSGFSGVANTMTEISIQICNETELLDSYTSLVNPGVKIPPGITRLTGISNEMIADAPAFKEIAKEVFDFLGDAIFVAHSVNFDYPIVARELAQAGYAYKAKKLCTVRYARAVIPGHRSYSLGNICSDLNIPITARHRAEGDAVATVQLLQHCIAQDKNQQGLKKMLNPRGRAGTLPPLLSFETFDALPDEPGVYHFLNEQQKVIYVGKAVNIKKRVSGHFTSQTLQSKNMKLEIADIKFQTTGTELIALLQESADIKRLFPKYNKAQKYRKGFVSLVSYQNQSGVIQIGYQQGMRPGGYPLFSTAAEAYRFLYNLAEQEGLCLQQTTIEPLKSGACALYPDYCEGICCGHESIDSYNERVRRVLDQITLSSEPMYIEGEGRNADERSFVYLEDGLYQGFGYVPNDLPKDQWIAQLQLAENNPETMGIIHGFILQELKELANS